MGIGKFVVGLICLALFSPCSRPATAAGQFGNSLASGTVTDESGKPIPDVRIDAIFREDPSIRRSTLTDISGKWVLYGLPEGEWKFTAQKDGMAPSSVIHHIRQGTKTPTFKISFVVKVVETKKFEAAKEALFNKNWDLAISYFTEFLNTLPGSHIAGNSKYWIAYCYYQKGRAATDQAEALKLMEQAIKTVKELIRTYPLNDWVDDAIVLEIEISGDLARRGHLRYRQEIFNILENEHLPIDMGIRMVAACTVMTFDAKGAFPELVQIIRDAEDPEIRKNAVYFLSQYKGKKVAEILNDVARNDIHEEVRKYATELLKNRDDGLR